MPLKERIRRGSGQRVKVSRTATRKAKLGARKRRGRPLSGVTKSKIKRSLKTTYRSGKTKLGRRVGKSKSGRKISGMRAIRGK